MTTCYHCNRTIVLDGDTWVDPEATGDDSVWRETCDAHDTFIADHEPTPTCATCPRPAQTVIHCSEGSGPTCLDCALGTRLEVINFEHLMHEANDYLIRPAHTCDDGGDCEACACEYAAQRAIDQAGRYKL